MGVVLPLAPSQYSLCADYPLERRDLSALLERHNGKVAAAARAAMDRVYVYKLLQRHNLKR